MRPLLIAVSLLAASGAAAQALWHEQALPTAIVPSGAVLDDLAFAGGRGYVALRVGSEGRVARLDLTLTEGPTLEDTGFPGGNYSFPFVVSYNGARAASFAEATNALLFIDEGAAAWLSVTSLAQGSIPLAEVDAAGGGAMLVGISGGFASEPRTFVGDGSSWVGHNNNLAEIVYAQLAGPAVVGFAFGGQIVSSPDVTALPSGGSWTYGPESVTATNMFVEDISGAWLGGGEMVLVGAAATSDFVLHVSGADTATPAFLDCSTSPVVPLRRVTYAAGALYALDRAGGVYLVENPADCASWAAAAAVFQPPSPYDEGVGLGAIDGETALVVGNRGAAAFVAWRNRPPVLGPIADMDLLEGDATSFTVTLDDPDPDPGNPGIAELTCDPPDVVTATPSGLSVGLSAAAGLCQGSVSASCRVIGTDGDRRSAPETFTVTITGSDEEAPVVTAPLALAPATVLVGNEVTVTFTATDDCAADLGVSWTVVADDDGSAAAAPAAGTASAGAPYEVSFPAPDGSADGSPRTYTVTAIVSDGVSAVSTSAPLTVLSVLPEATLGACPQSVTAGETSDAFTIAPDDAVPLSDWAFTFSASPDDDLVIDQPGLSTEAFVTPHRCAPAGSFLASWEATVAGTTSTLTCPAPTEVVALPSPASLSRVGPEEVSLSVGADGVAVALRVAVTDECSDENTVSWDLSGLPEVLRPNGAERIEQESQNATRTLFLSVPAAVGVGLLGQEAEVFAHLVPKEGEEPSSARFSLRFVAAADLASAGAVNVSLTAPSPRALGLGDVVRVEALVTQSLPFALPGLAFSLEDGELIALAETFEIEASSCGARGESARAEGGVRVLTAGVREGCALTLSFLARKGIERAPLRARSCTWGDGNEIAACAGSFTTTSPRALGCAQSEGSMSLLVLLALASLSRARRRRSASDAASSRCRACPWR